MNHHRGGVRGISGLGRYGPHQLDESLSEVEVGSEADRGADRGGASSSRPAEPNDIFWLLFRRPIQIVNRIAANNDQRINFGAVKIFDIACTFYYGGKKRNRVANRSKRHIDCPSQQMNFNRLPLAGDDQSIFAG